MSENKENFAEEVIKDTENQVNAENAETEGTETTENTIEIEPQAVVELTVEEKLAEANDKYVRLYAEFDNFRRRTSKERIDLFKTANQEMILAVIPILDDFDRATQAFGTATDIESVKEGVNLIHTKLKNILTQKGLKEMEAIGQTFDVEIHEAITNIPAPAPEMVDKIIDQMEKGYTLNDKVIRFAKVIVGV